MIRKNRATQSVTHLDHPTMSIKKSLGFLSIIDTFCLITCSQCSICLICINSNKSLLLISYLKHIVPAPFNKNREAHGRNFAKTRWPQMPTMRVLLVVFHFAIYFLMWKLTQESYILPWEMIYLNKMRVGLGLWNRIEGTKVSYYL